MASYLYSVGIALYLLTALYLTLPELIGPARHAGIAIGPILGAALLAGLLQVVIFTVLGLGIRAGKTWTKAIYLLLLVYALYVFGRAFPFFIQRSAWTMTKESFALALMLGVAFFLFRNNFTRRPVTLVAEGPVE